MRTFPLLAAAAIIAAVPLQAQSTPEAAAEAFGATIKANDWAGAARLMHPDALHQLRGLLEPLLTEAGTGEVTKQIFGVGSAAELSATPDTILFSSLLKTVMNQQGLAAALSTATFKALGHIDQPGDTVLVVSKMTMQVEKLTISTFDVMPFLLYQKQYRGLLKADFTNLVAMLKARFSKGS